MKYSKAGILKKKVGPASDILQEEAKRMEEKLSELKEFMQKEKEKRDSAPKMKDGSKWRSAVSTKPIAGYADLVLSQKGKVQTKPRVQSGQSKKEDYLPTSVLLNNYEEKPTFQPVPKVDEVLEFLTSCGMEKYHKVFIDNGIEEMEILLELTEGHLANMNVPLGHRLKILKKIKENKGKENTYKPVEKVTASENKGKTHEMCVGEDAEIPAGEFNEAESYNMFKEAIEQFRNSGSPTKHKVKAKATEEAPKKVRFLEPVTEEMLPKEIKGMLYEGAWAPEQAAVPETFEESSGTTTSVLIKERKSCWNCYKIFSATSVIKAFDKEFCCEGCVKIYFESRAVKCLCGNEFIKNEGILEAGVWVCSDGCVKLVQGKEDKGEKEEAGAERSDRGFEADKGDEGDKRNEEKVIEESESYEEQDDDFIGIDPVTGDPITKIN